MTVRDVEFSHGTYQVEVVDGGESFWPFLQFDKKATLSDAFCTCEQEEPCSHLAAALLFIYGDKKDPLHERFEGSFWNVLGHLLCASVNDDEKLLKKKGVGHYSFGEEIGFEAHSASGRAYLASLFEKRLLQTPENSLKFSTLPTEEIMRWQEGRPSSHLRYELSAFADIAKHCMVEAEKEVAYSIVFEEPALTSLRVEFPLFILTARLTENALEALIPTLGGVHSTLSLFERGRLSIVYDEKTCALHIQREKLQIPKHQGDRIIGGWLYVPHKGFYSIQERFPDTVEKEKMASFLNAHFDEVAALNANVVFHRTPLEVHYKLFFDPHFNLHFAAYLFEEKERATLFGNYAFIEGKGFYKIKGAISSQREFVVPAKDVSAFVSKHRAYLAKERGFTVHIAPVDAALEYSVDAHGDLHFSLALPLLEEIAATKDFGAWVYYATLGFFAKKTPPFFATLSGLSIAKQDVGEFIRSKKEELETIPLFFAQENPLTQRGLSLTLAGDVVIVAPYLQMKEGSEKWPLMFFGDFVYAPTRGFYELPFGMRIPSTFDKKVRRSAERFFDKEFPHLERFLVKIDPRLVAPKSVRLEFSHLSKAKRGFFEGQFFIVTERGKVPLQEVLEAKNRGERFLFSSAGRLDLTSASCAFLPHFHSAHEISALNLLRLEAEEGISLASDASTDTRQLLDEMRLLTVHEEPPQGELKSTLRLYQQTGLKWLWFLYRSGLSGLLCDDMGLGKTHQAMALLAAMWAEKKKESPLFLVVAPTSVIYHWQEKLSTFLPSLPLFLFHGIKRGSALPKKGVLLTSYGVLRVEKELLARQFFELAVFDEIQLAKNPESRLHQALLKMRSNMRVGLSGTPIENNLRELKSLFDIVLPGYMPSEKFFQSVEKEGDVEKKSLLHRLIKPFVLRRKKKEVLEELPEKCEDKVFATLSSDQMKLYKHVLAEGSAKITSELTATSVPYMPLFALLSKLKQICDHPALFAKDPANYKNYASGKWTVFTELVEEAIGGGQKIVVFSQYLHMLDIIKLYLQEKGWGFAEIRGETIDRQNEVKRFQEDDTCLVFVGSLTAAGLGIDLTAANIVILYDRWWNAARENQAIDRVHRIGQKWGVQVYKLITEGTIEEKIDILISRKSTLLDETIVSDEESTLKTLTRDELLALLTLDIK